MKNLFETEEGNLVSLFDIHRGIIEGQSITCIPVSLKFDGEAFFAGNVGHRDIRGLSRPRNRQGYPLTQEDLYKALDAAIGFDAAYTDHERAHECANAETCEEFG